MRKVKKLKGQNKSSINYSKESVPLVTTSLKSNKLVTRTVATHHRKNVASGGSYSIISTHKPIKKGYVDITNSHSSLKNAQNKLRMRVVKKPLKMIETKHKPSNTFGDLSTISTMISKTFQNNYDDKAGQLSSRKPKTKATVRKVFY